MDPSTDSNAATWDAVSAAPAHASLRKAAVDSGFNESVLRELLRVINAHPRLVAHGRVFENLASLLAHIRTGVVGRLGEWQLHLDNWIHFCEWASVNRGDLSNLHGLQQFNEQPKHSTDHPHIGEGVDRHAVVAAMWNRHESAWTSPPGTDTPHAQRYFWLQAHLLRSYIDARWKWASLDDYEEHVGLKEWPIAPAPTAAAARAVREFSHSAYDSFLSGLNTTLPDTDFFVELRRFNGQVNLLPEDKRIRAEAYLVHLKRYFKAAALVQSGKRPKTRRGNGSGGGPGTRARIPGYISVPDTKLVTRPPDLNDLDDGIEESWPSVGIEYWGIPKEEKDEVQSMEKSGLCPTEDLEPVLELVDAADYTKAMYGIHYGPVARDMAAQTYAWDWKQLTSGELLQLWMLLEQSIESADRQPSNKSVARYRRISALLVKLMLLYGQPFERAHGLQIREVSPTTAFTPTDIDDELKCMVFYVQRETNMPTHVMSVLGFGLPALSPIYKTDQDDGLSDLSRESALALVLPDVSNLGQQLLTFHASEPTQDQKVFHIDHPTALSHIKALLSGLDERITLARITRTLPSLVTQQTGDPSLALVACAEAARQTEPRLFYTMHATHRVRMAYTRAASTLLRTGRHAPSTFAPDVPSQDPPHIGCRFVLSKPVLRDLIETLKGKLTSRYATAQPGSHQPDTGDGPDQFSGFAGGYRDPSSRSAVLQYDRDYLLYTFLILTISTGTRAINQPVSLYLQWLAADEPKNGLVSGLWDKESMFYDKSRLVGVLPTLAHQFKHYRSHIEFLMGQLGQTQPWKSAPIPEQLLLTFDEKDRPHPLSPTWIEQQFEAHLGVPVPSNFSRAFLRTELLERAIHPELIDAFLGHASQGESPFAKLATFDYERYTSELKKAISDLLADLGLVPIASRLVPFPTRLATT